MKILTVVGTRPEFIQVAPLTRAIRARHTEILVHTGQHYDASMSDVFFEELGLPRPERTLAIGSGSHGEQTGRLLIELEKVMLEERPDWVVVFGDTNSTVAAALAAAKLSIPLAHVEAGLRSHDRAMPEELNRIVTDHLSQLLLAPTALAVNNLSHEGISGGVLLVGDVRVDLLENSRNRATARWPAVAAEARLDEAARFGLVTIHRASNTDDPARLAAILTAFAQLDLQLLLPVHPRLAKMASEFGLAFPANVRAVQPLGFLELLAALDRAAVVVTDSGGLQKEAYMAKRPAVTLRDTTEWVETVEAGWNRLCEPAQLKQAVTEALSAQALPHPNLYGAHGVCERIVDELERRHAERRAS